MWPQLAVSLGVPELEVEGGTARAVLEAAIGEEVRRRTDLKKRQQAILSKNREEENASKNKEKERREKAARWNEEREKEVAENRIKSASRYVKSNVYSVYVQSIFNVKVSLN